jgi:hypothetical protein
MRRRTASFALLLGLVVAGCGVGLGGGGVYQYAVDVTNGGNQGVTVAISMADGSVTRSLPAGKTTRLTGYSNGAYSVALVIEGPAKDAYLAKLEALKSSLQLARSSHNSAAVQIALANLPLVEQQLKDLMGSGLPGCGGTLAYQKALATVTLTNSSGLWQATCSVGDYGGAAASP